MLYPTDIRRPWIPMCSLSQDRSDFTLMSNEWNCEDLIKCPSLWLFRGWIVNPLYSLIHSGSLMQDVKPRTPENKHCQGNFLEEQNTLAELFSFNGKAYCTPHFLFLGSNNSKKFKVMAPSSTLDKHRTLRLSWRCWSTIGTSLYCTLIILVNSF